MINLNSKLIINNNMSLNNLLRRSQYGMLCCHNTKEFYVLMKNKEISTFEGT